MANKVWDTGQIKISGACGDAAVTLAMVTSDLSQVLDGVRYIFVAVPAFAHGAYAQKLAPIIRPGQVVLLLPGTFGSLIFWHAFRAAGTAQGVVVAETHTLPYVTCLSGEGEVLVMSRFNPLKVGVMSAAKTTETVRELSAFFDGLEESESAVACGLSSLNPIIHVPGCILNAGRVEYAQGEFFFHTEGFTRCVVRATEAVDRECIALLKHLGYRWDIAAHGIGSDVDTNDLHTAIAGNVSFAGIKGPVDTQSRYHAEDIPYGLALWAKLAKHTGVLRPVINSLVSVGIVNLEQDCWACGHSLQDLGLEGMDWERLNGYLQSGKQIAQTKPDSAVTPGPCRCATASRHRGFSPETGRFCFSRGFAI